MQGWTHKEIQERAPWTFNCVGCGEHARLSKAIAEIKQSIDPDTYQVSTLSPRERRDQQKQHLAKQSGANLAKLCKAKKWGYRELANVLSLRVDTLLEYLKGDRTPDAPPSQEPRWDSRYEMSTRFLPRPSRMGFHTAAKGEGCGISEFGGDSVLGGLRDSQGSARVRYSSMRRGSIQPHPKDTCETREERIVCLRKF